MHDIELKIKRGDWIFIVFVGVVFGALVSTVGYSLFDKNLFEGSLFGAIIGFFISLFSLIFITLSNGYILPTLPHPLWLFASMMFAFLSGFLGSFASFAAAKLLNIEPPGDLAQKIWEFSTAVGLLTCIVGVILHRLVKMRNENEKTSELLLQSRLRSLETQLNPHFMFNSINSIVELIHKDPTKAEEALIGVSSFLRSVMREESLIKIEEELANIQKYVALENIRFDGKICVSANLDKMTEGIFVPKFSIGLLVENAIKHGLIQNKPLNIQIYVTKSESIITIIVRNDGKELKKDSFGIGLTNLSERLKHLCDGSLEIGDISKNEFIIRLKASK